MAQKQVSYKDHEGDCPRGLLSIWSGQGIIDRKPKLLCLLSHNLGKVLTHTYITQNIWGHSWENDVASLRVIMATLRKKLEKNSDSVLYIQTHVGIGYRMIKVE